MTDIKIIERREVKRDYGFLGTEAIIDHHKHGRLLIADGYGQMDGARGGMVRWEHGMVIKLQPADTFASLEAGAWNESTTLMQAVRAGYDDTRPLQNWDGHMIRAAAKAGSLL